MTLSEQFPVFMRQIEQRRRRPAKPATLAAYQSYWRAHIMPALGSVPIADIENGRMRQFVSTLGGLAPASVVGITQLVKSIVASAVDKNGNEIYSRKWNNEFIDLPVVSPKEQHTPVLTPAGVSEALSKVASVYTPLLVLLASTGVRINEAMALKAIPCPDSSYWDAKESKIVVNKAMYHGREQAPKTEAGVREVDLCLAANEYLKVHFADKTNTYMFPFALRTVYDACAKAGVPGFHSIRRYRSTYLENAGVPRSLSMFWIGHARKDVHDRYLRLDADVKARKEWAGKAGLGFKWEGIQNP